MKILKSELLKFSRLVYRMRRAQIFGRYWGVESRETLEQMVDLELMHMGVDVEKAKLESEDGNES